MPELLMPPVAAKNQSPAAVPATATSDATRAANAQNAQGDAAPNESFASVLRKQIEQTGKTKSPVVATNNGNTTDAADASLTKTILAAPIETPLAAATDALKGVATETLSVALTEALKAGSTDTRVVKAEDTGVEIAPALQDAAAILPLLAQLLAQSTDAGTKAIDSLHPAETNESPDEAPIPLSGLLAKLGKPNSLEQKNLPDAVNSESTTANTDLNLVDAKPSVKLESMPEAAISAEAEVLTESGTLANSPPETDFAALLNRASNESASAQSSQQASPAIATAKDVTANLRMDRPAGHPAWSNELADKMTWMATSQLQQADLVLNPPQLGRVEISLTVTGDQASAVFASPNAAVREMLENSLPRLREILAGAGINLGEAQVGAESPGQFSHEQQRNNGAGGSRNGVFAAMDATVPATPAAIWQQGTRSMVDVFA